MCVCVCVDCVAPGQTYWRVMCCVRLDGEGMMPVRITDLLSVLHTPLGVFSPLLLPRFIFFSNSSCVAKFMSQVNIIHGAQSEKKM